MPNRFGRSAAGRVLAIETAETKRITLGLLACPSTMETCPSRCVTSIARSAATGVRCQTDFRELGISRNTVKDCLLDTHTGESGAEGAGINHSPARRSSSADDTRQARCQQNRSASGPCSRFRRVGGYLYLTENEFRTNGEVPLKIDLVGGDRIEKYLSGQTVAKC